MNNTIQKKVFLSPQGLKMFQDRLEKQHEAHAKICHEREVAHELSGDGWHDNPHFNYLQQMESNSSWKIFELQEVLNHAKCYQVSEGSRPTDKVTYGSIVKCVIVDIKTDEEREQILEIVGYEEGKPELSQVSYVAPLGKALMGLSLDDYRETKLPQGEAFIQVIELYKSRKEAGLSSLSTS